MKKIAHLLTKSSVLLVLLLPLQKTLANQEIEIDGLVIDRTLTRFGKDFNFYYSSYWREIPHTQGYNVIIHETVFPQAGTLLTLEINNQKIYRTHFGRRMSSVEDRAKQAILMTIDYLAKIKANELTGGNTREMDGY
ncbi:curli production assembly protein CsgE [Shewanella sp. OPT22]|nr:curli production assembly protein CsgE [Shewanella sp. OPT22]